MRVRTVSVKRYGITGQYLLSVVDGKFITSVGGALSYEPALYLVEKLYSKQNAKRIGEGLVLDWDLSKVPHVLVSK
jgi:transcriptional regulator GlxA family with amidase domain